jgi:hypothetical protein
MTRVQFFNCRLDPASAPALLARLMGGNAVADLFVMGDAHTTLDAPAATLLAGALRANTTLTSLQLTGVNFWGDVAAAATLLGALTAHPSLRTLRLSYDVPCEAHRAPAKGAFLRAARWPRCWRRTRRR